MRQLLRNYELIDVGFRIDKGGSLTLDGSDYDVFDLPRALKRDALPRRQDYPDEESWDRATFQLFHEDGEDGFLELLSETSSLLQTPLLVVALAVTVRGGLAHAWRVEPGRKEVESTYIERAAGFSGRSHEEECWANWHRVKRHKAEIAAKTNAPSEGA